MATRARLRRAVVRAFIMGAPEEWTRSCDQHSVSAAWLVFAGHARKRHGRGRSSWSGGDACAERRAAIPASSGTATCSHLSSCWRCALLGTSGFRNLSSLGRCKRGRGTEDGTRLQPGAVRFLRLEHCRTWSGLRKARLGPICSVQTSEAPVASCSQRQVLSGHVSCLRGDVWVQVHPRRHPRRSRANDGCCGGGWCYAGTRRCAVRWGARAAV
jgi:hypothetical protein